MSKFYDIPGHISSGEFARLNGIEASRISTLVQTGRLKGTRRGSHIFVKLGQRIVINPNYKPRGGRQKYLVIAEDNATIEQHAQAVYEKRSPNRSDAYSVGVQQIIWRHYGLITELSCPYQDKSAESDAYHAGIAEGRKLVKRK